MSDDMAAADFPSQFNYGLNGLRGALNKALSLLTSSPTPACIAEASRQLELAEALRVELGRLTSSAAEHTQRVQGQRDDWRTLANTRAAELARIAAGAPDAETFSAPPETGHVPLPNGCTLYWTTDAAVKSRQYVSDEIGGGVEVWHTALVDSSTLVAAVACEGRLRRIEHEHAKRVERAKNEIDNNDKGAPIE